METTPPGPLLPFILVSAGALAMLAWFIVSYSNASFIKRNFKKYLFLRGLERKYLPYLRHNFPFYNKLNDKQKILFERRVQKFIDIKEFIPRGGIREVTPEMKALLAGSAIQLTFGYPYIYFRHFWRILIYPDNYYSTITRKYHNGEVNPAGIIVVSWRNLKQGFEDHFDGRHLGLHEMAHALRLINIIDNPEYNFYDRRVMKEFDAEARKEITRIKDADQTSIFRDYGSFSLEEFFAVAVEVFFEKPREFKSYNQSLYSLLSAILKLDPLIPGIIRTKSNSF